MENNTKTPPLDEELEEIMRAIAVMNEPDIFAPVAARVIKKMIKSYATKEYTRGREDYKQSIRNFSPELREKMDNIDTYFAQMQVINNSKVH